MPTRRRPDQPADPHQPQEAARIGAPRAPHVEDTRIIRIGSHDRRYPSEEPLPTPPPPTQPGRTRARARFILPENLSDLTGLVPGTTARLDILDTGQLLLTPLPDQGATRLTYHADRLLRIRQAQDRQGWAIQMSLAGRAPYATLSRSARKQHRRIEARRGIPRDWPR